MWVLCKYISAAVFVAVALVAAQTSFAQGYSEKDNKKIWRLRLDAQKYASSQSEKECSWSPDSPRYFSDDLIFDEDITNKDLFITIMSALRLDQNARAISLAFRDAQSESKTGEVDDGNLSVLRNIISTYGFPTVDEVGERGVNAMLLLVAHADDDIEFQRSVASMMKKYVDENKLPEIYLIVLRSIRPTIFELSGSSDGESLDVNKNEHRSKMGCYNDVYQKMMDSYIRKEFIRQ